MLPNMTTKVCYRCKIDQPITEYYEDKRMISGRLNLCRTCKVIEADQWRRNNAERFNETRRVRYIEKEYGVSIEEYDRIATSQGGVCAGCKSDGTRHHGKKGHAVSSRPLAVDHDHITGKTRGLLCHQCNMLVGQSHDDADRLQNLADYLRRYQ
jgi:Recombination endonuclease VII